MKNENIQVGFGLEGIKTEQFAIVEENYNPKKEKEIGLATELQFKLDQKNKKIAVFLGFEFGQPKKVFLKILVSCHFSIQEDSFKKFIQKKEAKIIVPKGFLAHIAMITTGTSRGILFDKTDGSPYAKFIVPMLNVKEMITNDASFDLLDE